MKSDVGQNLICMRSINCKFLQHFLNISMQGRDSCRLNPTTLIQEQKYAAYRTTNNNVGLTLK